MKTFSSIIGMLIAIFLTPTTLLYAMEAELSSVTDEALVGKEVTIDIFLDTEGKSVNALSGEIVVEGPVMITGIRDGDSIIGAWVIKGDDDQTNWQSGDSKILREVRFSGIIFGGMTTAHGKVITVSLTPQQTGTIELTLTARAFENDGQGSPRTLRPHHITIPVRDAPTGDAATTSPETKDVTPPEVMRVYITQNDPMFEGKSSLIVEAKDTESGVGLMELLEANVDYVADSLRPDTSLPWRTIENPAMLLSPISKSFIYLRVTDRAGNSLVMEVNRPTALSPEIEKNFFNKWLISIILSGVTGLFLWLWYRRRTHHA